MAKLWWADGSARDAYGSTWFVAAILELRSGRLYREHSFFAPPLEPPAWRAQWVETLDGGPGR